MKQLKIWVKPGYSTLSKLLSFIAYKKAIEKEVLLIVKKIGNSYMFKIKDIIRFIDD